MFDAVIGIVAENNHRTFEYVICDVNGWFSNKGATTLHPQRMSGSRPYYRNVHGAASAASGPQLTSVDGAANGKFEQTCSKELIFTGWLQG